MVTFPLRASVSSSVKGGQYPSYGHLQGSWEDQRSVFSTSQTPFTPGHFQGLVDVSPWLFSCVLKLIPFFLEKETLHRNK